MIEIYYTNHPKCISCRKMFRVACEAQRRKKGLVVNNEQIINCLDCELMPEECEI